MLQVHWYTHTHTRPLAAESHAKLNRERCPKRLPSLAFVRTLPLTCSHIKTRKHTQSLYYASYARRGRSGRVRRPHSPGFPEQPKALLQRRVQQENPFSSLLFPPRGDLTLTSATSTNIMIMMPARTTPRPQKNRSLYAGRLR